jgi:hypothetical protein
MVILDIYKIAFIILGGILDRKTFFNVISSSKY